MLRNRLLLALALVTTPTFALADTVQFGAAEINLPDEGWSADNEDGMMTLGLEKGGAFIEVYDFSKAPAPDQVALTKLVAGRKETTDVAIAAAAPHEQNGLKGITFSGTAKIRGKAVAINGIGLNGIGERAVMVVAFNLPNVDKADQKAIADVLASVRRGK